VSEFPDRPVPAQSLVTRARSWLEWVGVGRVVASAVVVLAVIAGAYWLVQPPTATTESKLPYAKPSSTTPPATTSAPVEPGAPSTDVVVHVAGAVAAPGVYRLEAGQRVIDAVNAAGGMSLLADADAINLAALVVDGQRIYVPEVGEVPPVVLGGGAGGDASTTPSGPVNLNSATADELDALPGVGPATAAAIIAHRDQHGPFASVEALADVRGIGPAKLDALRGLVMV
jgi:competence protein ComEA